MKELPTPLPSAPDLPFVEVRIYAAGFGFLQPYTAPYAHFVEHPDEADFILTMNHSGPDALDRLAALRTWRKPIVWWTIEDPNSFEAFLPQAEQADFVFTTDEACLPRYRSRLGHDRVYGLPLACSPADHRPLDSVEEASDFVLSANWYRNEARRWGVATVVDPLLDAGYTLTLFCYESFMWPPRYRPHWRGETTYHTVAEQYRHGRVVLGLNNQRSGMDGRGQTFMTSMRTFEALACGKPFLSAHSDAYERLGFVHGAHFAWVDQPSETLLWAERLLGGEGARLARAGRQFVLSRHTYAHRLARMAEVVVR